MALQLFINLIALAAASLLITQGRRKKIWSVLILAALAAVAYCLFDSLSQPSGGGFIYQWLPYKELHADINITSSPQMQHLFLSMVWILIAVIYLNTINAEEKHSLHINTLILLNFVAMILLVSAHDFLQLMFAGCLFSLIGFYMPETIAAKKRVFIYGFFAEMAVFTALSIVYGSTSSVSLNTLADYAESGRHKDLTAFLVAAAVACKSGFLLANGQYLSFRNESFSRIISVMFLSLPVSGLLLLFKLTPLVTASPVACRFFEGWAYASVGAACVAAVCDNSLKSKALGLSLAVYALLAARILVAPQALYALPILLSAAFAISLVLLLALTAASGEDDAAHLGGFWRLTKINFLLTILLAGAVAALLLGQGIWFESALILAFAAGIKEIYLARASVDDKVRAFAKNAGWLYIVPIFLGCGGILSQIPAQKLPEWGVLCSLFAAGLLLWPTGLLLKIGAARLWRTDICGILYQHLIVMPLKWLGRILWLAFDFVVIERNIIGSISSLEGMAVSLLHKMQENVVWSSLLGILAGLAALACYMGIYLK